MSPLQLQRPCGSPGGHGVPRGILSLHLLGGLAFQESLMSVGVVGAPGILGVLWGTLGFSWVVVFPGVPWVLESLGSLGSFGTLDRHARRPEVSAAGPEFSVPFDAVRSGVLKAELFANDS